MPHHHNHGHDHHSDDHRRHHHLEQESLLVIRPNSGLAGDIMVAGLLAVSGAGQAELDALLSDLRLEQLIGRVKLVERQVNEVTGVGLAVDLPHEHEHRGLKDIENFFAETRISDQAKALAIKSFRILAEAEGAVHNRRPDEVHFHEVGALDSIMDMGLASALVSGLNPGRIISGPLPICDGVVRCAHGLLPSPAPAVLRLLEGVPVVGLNSLGETITPTAVALLKAFDTEFGPWPAILLERQSLAYGTRILEGVPNGAIFAFGRFHGLGRA